MEHESPLMETRQQPFYTELSSLNLKKWIDENRTLLKPPVNNKVIWKNRELIVMMVGGPNHREDFHINEGEEFFYQLKGQMTLRIMEPSGWRDIAIKEEEVFLLPPMIPHSPRRPAHSIGMVVERKRREGEKDGFIWYCDKCHTPLYQESLILKNIETQLPEIFSNFYNHPEYHACKKCGYVHHKEKQH